MIKIEKDKIAAELRKINYFLLLSVVFITPFILSGSIVNSFYLPKWLLTLSFVAVFLISISVIWILENQIIIPKNFVYKPLLVFLASFATSALFSLIPKDSFLGRTDYFALSFASIAIFVIFLWGVVYELNTSDRFNQIIKLVVLAGMLSSAIFITKYFFHASIVNTRFAEIWNTVDVGNVNFAVWLAVTFLISVALVIKKDVTLKWYFINGIAAFLALVSLAVINFKVALWLVLVGLILLLFFASTFYKASDRRVIVAISGAIIAVIFLLGLRLKLFPGSVPFETRLNHIPSASITLQTIGSGLKEAVFGTGPGTFANDFSKFRDVAFNYNSDVGNLRFNYPYSTLFAMVAESGLFGLLSFLAIYSAVAYQIARNWKKLVSKSPADDSLLGDEKVDKKIAKEMQGMDVVFLFVVWTILTIGMVFVLYNFLLWWFWWLLLGIMISGLNISHKNDSKNFVFSLTGTPKKQILISIGLIFGYVVIIFFTLLNWRWYKAEKYFAVALAQSDFKSAEMFFKKAVGYHNTELYHIALSGSYLKEAEKSATASKPNLQTVTQLLGNAINEGRIATNIAPLSVNAWDNLAGVYEKSAGVAPEARSWAIRSLKKAYQLEPSNAFYAARLANNLELSGNWTDAATYYEEAVELKTDFSPAYISLANAYEHNKEINKAIEIFSIVFQRSPNNYEALYNYGRLLYNRNSTGDRDAAEKLWLKVTQINPNYSNALYSLGLISELRGNRKLALSYYYKVRELNPGNQSIVQKIRKLGGN